MVLLEIVGAIPRHSDSVKASQAFLVVHVCMYALYMYVCTVHVCMHCTCMYALL